MVTKRPVIDVTNESRAYWENILKSEGLGVDAGREHHGKLKYIGNSEDILVVEEIMVRKRGGRVRPSGSGPDDNN